MNERITTSGEARAALLASHSKMEKCQLYELVQYQCEVGRTHIECNPFVRLFLRCAGKPTVEVTPEYDQNGEPVSSVLPDFGSVDSKMTPPGLAMMDEN